MKSQPERIPCGREGCGKNRACSRGDCPIIMIDAYHGGWYWETRVRRSVAKFGRPHVQEHKQRTVTPEMIEAGTRACMDTHDGAEDDLTNPAALVAAYRAMRALEPLRAVDPNKYRWKGEGPEPEWWFASDGTKVYRDLEAYYDV
jgi:hypothetical protein